MKMKLKKTLILILLSSMSMLKAQTTWHFGTNSGIKFTGNVASSIGGSSINTNEGAAGIVDQNNNVLLYTDGSKVWNGNHTLQLTINTGTYAAGMTNSTHAAAISPIPGTNNQYFYIFTVTDGITSVGTGTNGGYGPLKVSKVKVTGVAPNTSITFDNITTDKDIIITPPNVRVGEKIAITTDNTCGYWVTVHGVGVYGGNFQKIFNNVGENIFYTYHVTPTTTSITALQSSSVTSVFTNGAHKAWNYSYMGGDSNTTPYNFTPSAQTTVKGQMKFNPEGNRLACAVTSGQEFQLYNFNKTTGVFTNQIRVGGFTPGGPKGWCGNGLPYGVEFSPNGNFLYITTNFTTAGYNGFIQFNVQSTNTTSTQIQTSSRFIYQVDNMASPFGGLQKGPDNKIYMAWNAPYSINTVNYLNHDANTTYTQNPNMSSLTNVNASGINGVKLGLPTVLQIKPVPVISSSVTISNTVICSGNAITVNANYNGNVPVEYHGWIIEECTQSGVSVSGGYNSNVIWDPNQLGMQYTFPLSSQLACNKYYKITSVTQNLINCLNETLSEPKIIYLSCNPNGLTTISNICLGNSATLCVDDIYNLPSNTYTVSWGKKGNNINCINVTPAIPGQTNYAATITNTITGCVGQKSFVVNTYNNNPKFSTTTAHTNGTNYFTVSTTVVDQTANTQPGFTYQWDILNTNTSLNTGGYQPCWWHNLSAQEKFPGYNGTNSVDCVALPSEGHFPTFQTYKIVRSTWNTYCSVKKDSAIVTNSGSRIGNFDNESSFTNTDKSVLMIYPNPSNGLVKIHVLNSTDKSYKFEVCDVYGKIIFKKEEENKQNNDFMTELNLNEFNLSNGLYILKVKTDNQILSKRIIIEK